MKKHIFNLRLLEIITASASLFLIAFLFIGSLFFPLVVAVIVIVFDTYWLYKSVWFACNAIRSYRKIYNNMHINWLELCQDIDHLEERITQIEEQIHQLQQTYKFFSAPKMLRSLFAFSSLRKPYISYTALRSRLKEYKEFYSYKDELYSMQDIHHVLIIPEWKEPMNVLEDTIERIAAQNFPLNQISVVLATEARDPEAEETIRILTEKYGSLFKHFWATKHPLTEGEIVGKSSNMAYAGRWVEQALLQEGYDLKKVTITSCDADSLLPQSYYSYVTYKFITDREREYHFYHGAMLYYTNFWEIPFPIRMVVTFSSIWNLSHLVKQSLLPLSTYTLALDSVRRAGYWSVDVIPEDYHIFFKTFFALGEKVRVIPIFLPIYSSAPQSDTYFKTLKSQYSQMKRWAWGISDDPYIIRESFKHREISFFAKFYNIFRPLEDHIFWPVNWFIITIGANLPVLFNKKFAETALGFHLPGISQFILTICLGALFIVIIIESKVRPKSRIPWPWWKKPLLLLQWFTLPIVTLLLSALPGLDAHTRLLLGKRLEYKVTEKVRKE